MLMSAGSGSEELWYNDIYLLEIGSWQWSKVNLVGDEAPSPRDYSAISTIADRVSGRV